MHTSQNIFPAFWQDGKLDLRSIHKLQNKICSQPNEHNKKKT